MPDTKQMSPAVRAGIALDSPQCPRGGYAREIGESHDLPPVRARQENVGLVAFGMMRQSHKSTSHNRRSQVGPLAQTVLRWWQYFLAFRNLNSSTDGDFRRPEIRYLDGEVDVTSPESGPTREPATEQATLVELLGVPLNAPQRPWDDLRRKSAKTPRFTLSLGVPRKGKLRTPSRTKLKH
jgi:hypothetical protein